MEKNIKVIERGWCSILQGEVGGRLVPLAMFYRDEENCCLWAANDTFSDGKVAISQLYNWYVQLRLVDDIEYMPTSELLECCDGELTFS